MSVDGDDIPVRVVLGMPELILRCGLVEWLDGVRNIDVVGEASTGSQTLEAFKTFEPRVLILSPRIVSPGFSEVCRAVRSHTLHCFVVLVVVEEHRDLVLAAAKAGVRGLLCVDISPENTADAIQGVSRGKFCYSEQALSFIIEDYATVADARASAALAPMGLPETTPKPESASSVNHRSRDSNLSKREQQVLAAVAAGLTSRAIAEQLGISARTVEAHRARLGDKLGIRTVAGLTRFALKMGLMPKEL